jgi:ubiquinone/menaquinone biosynthesis C-methylase UbiE
LSESSSKPHYGYYGLGFFALFVTIIILVGVATAFWLWWPLGILVIAAGVALLLNYGVSMHLLGQSKSLDPPPMLGLKGDETVLDVGCGLGKMTVGIAKHLKTGRVIGIDVWSKAEIPGNSAERATENARIEGVADRTEFRTGNVLAIPFDDGSFDVVTSVSVINNLHNDEDKLKALKEICRVLRPEGKLLLLEPLRDLRGAFVFTPLFIWMTLPREKWIELLKNAGFDNLEYRYFEKMGAFFVKKPIRRFSNSQRQK